MSLANIAAYDASATVLNSLTIAQSYAGTIGAAGAGGYLKIGTVTATIGVASGDGVNGTGSGRIKLDFGTGALTATILQTGNSQDSGQEPVRLLLVNSGNVVNVVGGRVGIATNVPGEVSTVGTVNVVGRTAVCNFGSGVTFTTIGAANAGSVTTNSGGSGTTLNVGATAKATANGTTKIATVTNYGQLAYNVRPSSGACCTTMTNFNGGTIDYTGNPATGTITTFNAYAGSTEKVNSANPAHIVYTSKVLQGVGTSTYS